MSDHLIAEANRHAKALPKMTLPTTKPNDLDLAWYRRECELLQDRNEALERENAAMRAAIEESEEFARNTGETCGSKIRELLRENAALREQVEHLVGMIEQLEGDLAHFATIEAFEGKKEAQP